MKKLQTLCLCCIVFATACADDDDRGHGRNDDYYEPAVIPEASTYGTVIAVGALVGVVWFKRNRKA